MKTIKFDADDINQTILPIFGNISSKCKKIRKIINDLDFPSDFNSVYKSYINDTIYSSINKINNSASNIKTKTKDKSQSTTELISKSYNTFTKVEDIVIQKIDDASLIYLTELNSVNCDNSLLTKNSEDVAVNTNKMNLDLNNLDEEKKDISGSDYYSKNTFDKKVKFVDYNINDNIFTYYSDVFNPTVVDKKLETNFSVPIMGGDANYQNIYSEQQELNQINSILYNSNYNFDNVVLRENSLKNVISSEVVDSSRTTNISLNRQIIDDYDISDGFDEDEI